MKQHPLFIGCLYLLLPVLLRAQANEADLLRQQFEQYQTNHLQEKVFLHADRQFYIAGELCWFSAFVTDAASHRPLALSRVLYVEIINGDGKPVQQTKIALSEGRGNGSFMLPASLPSGTYSLRAYTARMQNDGADKFFRQTITIANTLRDPVQSAPGRNFLTLGIFPEGGDLVSGLKSEVAVELADRYGMPVTGKGFLVADGNDTLAAFNISEHGFGRVNIQPQKEKQYHFLIQTADTSFSKDLPAAFDQGATMRVARSNQGAITVMLSGSAQLDGRTIYLLAHNRQRLKWLQALTLTEGKAVCTLPADSLGEGITRLTLFNDRRQPLCERLVFQPAADRSILAVTADKPVYDPRSEINIRLQPTASNEKISSSISIAAFRIDSLQPFSYTDMRAWWLLQSECTVPSTISPSYCTDTSEAAKKLMDDLMLTRGWRRFKWEDTPGDKQPFFNFVTELEGPVVSGTMQQRITGKPAPAGLAFMLTVPGERFDASIALTNSNGVLHFPLRPFYGNHELVITPVNPVDSNYKFTPGNSFAEVPGPLPEKQWKPLPELKEALLERSIAVQVDNAYETEKKKVNFQPMPESDSLRFYGLPDKSFYLDDYTRFVTMEEVVRELLTTVKTKKENGRYTFFAVNGAFKEFFDNPPLVLIDGVPATDHTKIMNMDPLRIKKVDVNNHKYFLGPLVCEGLLSFQTYAGDLAGYDLDRSAVVVEFDGLQRQRQFYSPAYETDAARNSRLPDTRSLLFWEPNINLLRDAKKIKFYSSDLKGKYAVVIQALAADGTANTKILEFEVR